jgi:hypothetical protein
MKRLRCFFVWLVFVSVSWASTIDCPCALDLIEDGIDLETGAGDKEFAQSLPPDRNDPLASQLGHGVELGDLGESSMALEPVERFHFVPCTVESRVLTPFIEPAAPRPPPPA